MNEEEAGKSTVIKLPGDMILVLQLFKQGAYRKELFSDTGPGL